MTSESSTSQPRSAHFVVFRVAVLAYCHFVVDFYVGLTVPLAEPTLVRHLSASLFAVMLIISASAIVVNAIQPLSGLILPRRGLPPILLWCPILAGMSTLIGLTDSYPMVFALLVGSAVAVGLVHPEAALTAQNLPARRKKFALSAFMSAGFFGFSFGTLTGGWWAQRFGLKGFWLMAGAGLVAAVLVHRAGLHRTPHETRPETEPVAGNSLPFYLVFPLAACVATTYLIIARFLPVYLVRTFGPDGQSWAGTTLFAIGLSGAAGSYFWGYLNDRFRGGRLVALAFLLAIPFLYGLLKEDSLGLMPLWGVGLGIAICGPFPICVGLARESRGGSHRLRLGLCIGGSWGLGELLVIVCAKHVNHFPANAAEPVMAMLNGTWITLGLVVLLGLIVAKFEARRTTRSL